MYYNKEYRRRIFYARSKNISIRSVSNKYSMVRVFSRSIDRDQSFFPGCFDIPFFPFGRYRSETINLLILEDPKDSSNVSFLGPMKFIGIGRCPVKYRYRATILEQLGVGPFFRTITDTKIMGKLDSIVNCSYRK